MLDLEAAAAIAREGDTATVRLVENGGRLDRVELTFPAGTVLQVVAGAGEHLELELGAWPAAG